MKPTKHSNLRNLKTYSLLPNPYSLFYYTQHPSRVAACFLIHTQQRGEIFRGNAQFDIRLTETL